MSPDTVVTIGGTETLTFAVRPGDCLRKSNGVPGYTLTVFRGSETLAVIDCVPLEYASLSEKAFAAALRAAQDEPND